MVRLTRSLTQEPFAEKRTAEAIFAVVVVYDILPFEFGDGLFYGCRAKDLRCVKECAGVYLLAAASGDGAENACLLGGKLLDRKCEVIVFTGESPRDVLCRAGCRLSSVGTRLFDGAQIK